MRDTMDAIDAMEREEGEYKLFIGSDVDPAGVADRAERDYDAVVDRQYAGEEVRGATVVGDKATLRAGVGWAEMRYDADAAPGDAPRAALEPAFDAAMALIRNDGPVTGAPWGRDAPEQREPVDVTLDVETDLYGIGTGAGPR